MEITQRDRRSLVLAAIALAAIALYFFGIEPLFGSYSNLVDTHKSLAAKVARIMRDNQKAAYLSERIAQWEAKAATISPPLAYSEQITTIGESIMAAAKGSGVQIKNANWTPPKPWPDDPGLQIALTHMDAQANWENVFKFIAAIYRITGVLSIEQVNLTGTKKGGQLTLRLTVSVMVKATLADRGQ